MNKITNFLTRFYKYMFLGQIENRESDSSLSVEEIPVEELYPEPVENETKPQSQKQKKRRYLSTEQIRNKLIIRINAVLVIVCCASFIVILIYTLFYPEKSVPDIIQNAFFTTLGWFGGALGTFFQVEND